MANRLKMVQKELLHILFSHKWSDRKINKATGIHRKTISGYKKEWQQNLHQQLTEGTTKESPEVAQHKVQNAPPDEMKCPPTGVVHFEVPTGSSEVNPPISSRSKASPFHELIWQKLQNGQHARSIYQDLVVENDYSGSYDSIKRYVRKLKKKSPQLYARIETAPAEEAQVDFGEGAPTLKNGRYYKPGCL